jgi:hypothetical protein
MTKLEQRLDGKFQFANSIVEEEWR